jgi:transposase
MPRGKPLSDDLRGVILNMGMNHDIDSIAAMTRVKRRTIERIFQDYRNKGTVMRQNMYKELRGRKHSLTVSDTNVSSPLCAKRTSVQVELSVSGWACTPQPRYLSV